MLSLILALTAGALGFVAGKLAFDTVSGVLIGLALSIPLYIYLVRRAVKRVEQATGAVEGHMRAQRFGKAIEALDALRPLAKWQPFLAGSIEAQKGMLMYGYLRDHDGALPHLQKAHFKMWQAHVMLAALYFKRKRYDDMVKVFERSSKRNKKEGLLWAAYGYCEWKRGEKDHALAVLRKGATALPQDARLKAHITAIENGKKPKMSVYGPEWLLMQIDGSLPALANAPRGGGFQPPPHVAGVRGRMRSRVLSGR